MKIIIIFLGICWIPLLSNAQTRQPDTLQLETKSGQKIILVGTDLNSFKNIKTDSIIQNALSYYKDSLNVDGRLVKKKLTKADLYTRILTKRRFFVLQPGIGAGLIRDKVSPFMGLTLDFAPQRQDFYGRKWGDYTFIDLTANAFYSFKDNVTNDYHTYTNIFLEGSIGNRYNNRTIRYFYLDELSFGAGYLIRDQGGYFKGNTFKIFVSGTPTNSFIRVKPEIYLTDDFKNVFPGITVAAKLFREEPLFHKRNKQKGKPSQQIKYSPATK